MSWKCWLLPDQRVIGGCFAQGGRSLFGLIFVRWPQRCKRCGKESGS